MNPLILPTTVLTLILTPQIHAHTRFTTLHINGVSQGDGTCIRQDPNPGTTTDFVPSITGPEMACGVGGSIAVPSTCPVAPGDTISLEHRMWPDGSQPGAIDVSHKGNTAIYMKKIGSGSDEVTGDGWFKIYWDGYDAATGQWGTDNMSVNNGLVTTNIPSDLASGDYLVRSEVLALQEVGDPQMYVGCAQVQLSGSGSAVPSNTVSIPGYVDPSTPAMQVNIYESFSFQEYGPTVYGPGGASGNGTSGAPASVTSGKSSGGSASSSSVADPYSPDASASASTKTSAAVSTASAASPKSLCGNTSVNTSSNAQTPPDNISVDDAKDRTSDCDCDCDSDDEEESDEDGDKDDSDTNTSWSSWAKWNNGKARTERTVAAIKKLL